MRGGHGSSSTFFHLLLIVLCLSVPSQLPPSPPSPPGPLTSPHIFSEPAGSPQSPSHPLTAPAIPSEPARSPHHPKPAPPHPLPAQPGPSRSQTLTPALSPHPRPHSQLTDRRRYRGTGGEPERSRRGTAAEPIAPSRTPRDVTSGARLTPPSGGARGGESPEIREQILVGFGLDSCGIGHPEGSPGAGRRLPCPPDPAVTSQGVEIAGKARFVPPELLGARWSRYGARRARPKTIP